MTVWRLMAATVFTMTLALLSGGHAVAQEPFRLTFERQPDEPTSIVLSGTLSNGGARDVVEVWVSAEAVSVAGRVVARGLAYVSPRLRGGAVTKFTVKLPRVEEVQTFRVFVSSFRYLDGTESP